MASSVRTKAREKQLPFASAGAADATRARKLEQAALELEDVVFHLLNPENGHAPEDEDGAYWNRTLNGIGTQVSLALNEFRGPRRFHYHYRHDPKDYETLYPVAGPAPLETLARVCREALRDCEEMVGVRDENALAGCRRLKQALRGFLAACGK